MKGIGAACGKIRQSMRHHAETMYIETTDAASDRVNKWDWSPSSEGAMKESSDKGEYKRFTMLKF